jgi:hypothetical protein
MGQKGFSEVKLVQGGCLVFQRKTALKTVERASSSGR